MSAPPFFNSLADIIVAGIETYAERDADRSRRLYLSSRLLGQSLGTLGRSILEYARAGVNRYGLETAAINEAAYHLVATGRADWGDANKTLLLRPQRFSLTHEVCPSWQSWTGSPRRPISGGRGRQRLSFTPSSLDALPKVDGLKWRSALSAVREILLTGPSAYHNPAEGFDQRALRNTYPRPLTLERESDCSLVATLSGGAQSICVYVVDEPRIDSVPGIGPLNSIAATLVDHNAANIAAKLGRPGARLALSSTPQAAVKLYWAYTGLPFDELAMAVIAQTDPEKLPTIRKPKNAR